MEENEVVEVPEEVVEEVAEGLDLHELHAKKTTEMKEKYANIINDIAVKNGVDLGVAFDMLKAVARGGNYAEGLEAEFDLDELKTDYLELAEISEQIYNG